MDIATVCRSGGEYRPHHANTLARQVWRHCGIRLSVLTDYDPAEFDDVAQVIKAKRDWPGWWSKLELFEVWTGEPVLYMDLDTVVIGDCKHMVSDGRLMMLEDVYRRGGWQSSVMTWAADYSAIAKGFARNSSVIQREYSTKKKWGDQVYIGDRIGKGHANWLGEKFPGQTQSFKAHVMRQGLGPDVRIVYFHGRPRPWDVDLTRYGIETDATTDTESQ